METALRQSKLIVELQGKMKRQLYSDNLVVESGQVIRILCFFNIKIII